MFELPPSTTLNKNIPKSAFDQVTNTKQKRQFTDIISKIRWANKLSPHTINLSGKDINEIQIFEVQLKKKEQVFDLLNVIDKSIPYHIIFILKYGEEVLFSASQKHPHPANEGVAVIDWNFKSGWVNEKKNPFQLVLRKSLDFIFQDFCHQLSGRGSNSDSDLTTLIEKERKLKELESSISKLQSAIKRTKQFNLKVEMNLKLQNLMKEVNEVRIEK